MSTILTKNGQIVANTPENRIKHYGSGWRLVNGVKKPIKLKPTDTLPKEERKKKLVLSTTRKKHERNNERLESREQMFSIGMGQVTRKKPGSGGSILPNGRLNGMGTNSIRERAYERMLSAEMRIHICIQ